MAEDGGLHSSTVAGSDFLAPMDMSVDGDGLAPREPELRREHHPGPIQLPSDPSTDIPLDPTRAESHYLDVDDFEADESESESEVWKLLKCRVYIHVHVHVYVHALK